MLSKAKTEKLEHSFVQGINNLKNNYIDLLDLNINNHQLSFKNIVVVHSQKSYAAYLGSYDFWTSVGRFVKKGSTSATIYQDRNMPSSRYLYDITDTDGQEFIIPNKNTKTLIPITNLVSIFESSAIFF